MELPSLPYNFEDAQITNVTFGPRREFTLTLSVVIWEGQNGNQLEGVQLRFGGVKNLAQVAEFFANKTQEKSEVSSIQYDPACRSKIGDLHFKLSLERIEAVLHWNCSSLTAFGPLPE